MQVIPDSAHTGQLFFCHRAAIKGYKIFLHLFHVLSAHHAYVHRGIGKHEAIAVNRTWCRFTGRHLFGIEEFFPPGSHKGNNPRPVFAGYIRKRLCLRAPVNRVVANVKYVKQTFLLELGIGPVAPETAGLP